MKNYSKIVPLLIVMFLGIFSYPQLVARINNGDTIKLQDHPRKKQNFSGFIIDASPADRFLYQKQTEFADEIHAQIVPTSDNDLFDRSTIASKNIQSESCLKSNLNTSSPVIYNPKCINHQEKSKK